MFRRRAPALAACLACGIVGAAIADSVYQIPVQVSDSLDVLIEGAEAGDTWTLFLDAASSSSTTLRPLRYLSARWLVTLAESSGFSYHTVFRGAHAAMALALLLLFAHVLRIRTWIDLAAMGVPLAVLVGHHSFVSVLREGYPLNHYALVAVCTLVTLALARRRPHWSTDIVIGATLGFLLLLIESGGMVWTVAVACWAVGLPGMRRSTVALATIVVVACLLGRLAAGIGAPLVGGNSSGYLDAYYEADALRERFGNVSLWFMSYNVVAGIGSVILSEPRLGMFTTLRGFKSGQLLPVVPIDIASSLVTTAIVFWYLAKRVPCDRAAWTDDHRLAIVAAAVLAGNALLVVGYIKDEILAVGAVFYAVATFVAIRALVLTALDWRPRALALTGLTLLVAGGLWTFRAAGAHYQLRATAFTTRNEWVEDVHPENLQRWSQTERGKTLAARLRDEAISHRVASRSRLPRWGERYWRE